MTLTGKNKIKKGIIASLCIILTLIVGLSVTLFPNSGKILGFNTAKAQTTKSEGWQPGSSTNSNYHLLKTVTPVGNGIYDVDVYAANIEHTEKAAVFIIWDNSYSMTWDTTSSWLPQEKIIIQQFLTALRPNFSNFQIRLSDFGSLLGNNYYDTGWKTVNSTSSIQSILNSTIPNSRWPTFSGSRFDENFKLAVDTFVNSTTFSKNTKKIVLFVSDGVPANAAQIGFNETRASKAVSYANILKNNGVTIFTACVTSNIGKRTDDGIALMSQLATGSISSFEKGTVVSTPYTQLGVYSDNEIQSKILDFAKLAAISNEEHFQKGDDTDNSTWLRETINSPYFKLYSDPVVTTQAFTGNGFSDEDVACVAQIDITDENTNIRVSNFDYGAYRCYKLGTTPYGSRLHLHYQIKAQRVIHDTTVNTHKYSSIDWKNHDTGYWRQIELPGLNVTLVPEEYKINYHANGGSGTMTSQTAICGTTISLKTNTFTRNGYAFNGWNTKADGTGISYENNDSFNNSSTNDVNLYAMWTPTAYTIEFKPNGGSGTMSPQKVPYDTEAKLNENKFTNSYNLTLNATGGKVYEKSSITSTYFPGFKGWATSATGNVVYADKAIIRNISQPNTTKYLYAKWEARVQLPMPIRDHYTFVEWNTNRDGEGEGYKAGETITLTSEQTLYAIWNPDEFTIKYNLNGGYAPGSITFNNQTGNYETDVTVHNGRPDKNGYTFFGWSTDSGSFTEDSRDYKPNDIITYQDVHQSVTTLNAIYESSIYLDALGGWFETGNEHYNDGDTMAEYIYYTGVITENDYIDIDSFPIPVWPGYRFKGWEDVDENLYKGSIPPENLYLCAIWEEVPTYTITYDANDNEAPYAVGGVPETQIKTEGLPIDVSFSPTPTREGHKFLGWSTEPDATSPRYTTTSNVYSIDANATMYAVWQRNKYIITYNANGGIGAPTEQEKLYNIDVNISNITPTREKYTFKGWATTETAATAEYKPDDVCSVNENLNLYAVWEKTKYTVTYNYAANGGTSVSVESKLFDPDFDEFDTSPVAYKEGWTFVGWAKESNSNVLIQPGKFEMKPQNITVYAVYKKDVITYFSSYDTYNFETKVDTPIVVHTEAYNNDTTVTVFPPDIIPKDIEGSDTYEAGKIKDGCEFTMQYYPRKATFSSRQYYNYMSNVFEVDVNEENEDALHFDAVYSVIPHLYYDTNGGEEIENTSSFQTYRVFGAREGVAFEFPNTTVRHNIESEAPIRTGYTFTGWNIPVVNEKNERYLPGAALRVTDTSPLALADFPAYAQWLSSSISVEKVYEIKDGEKVDSAVRPGSYITYTVTAETTGAADIITLLATVPENTTLVDDLITTPEGKVVFVFEDVPESSVKTASYTVKINDDVSNNEVLTASLTSELLCQQVDIRGNTSDVTFTHGPTSVDSTVSFNYHITYVMNTGESGTCPVDETEYSGSGTDIAELKSNTISKTGYKFIGWHDKTSDDYYSAREKITVTRNFILEPAWAKVTTSLNAPDRSPGKPVTYTFTIELPKNYQDVTIRDSVPSVIRVQHASLSPLTYTVDTVDKDEPVITYRNEAVADTKDTVSIHINNTHGVSRYQMVVSGIFDENAKPGSNFSNGITITVPTIGGNISSPITGASLKYLLTYITGPEYSDTGRYLNDTVTKRYSGDDVLFELNKDGSIHYYTYNTNANLLSPPEEKAKNFVVWSNAPVGAEEEVLYYSAQESYPVTQNSIFYARYIDIKQEIQNKQDNYIPNEEYIDKISIVAPCTGSMDIVIEGRLGSDLLAVVNEEAEFITNIEKEDTFGSQRYIITIDAIEGQTYELNIKAKVNSYIVPSEEPTTGCNVSALVRGNEYEANDDLIDVAEYYTIVYNLNGGQGETPVDTKYYRSGDKAVLASDEGLTKENYTFGNWCTTNDGYGTNYSDNEEITITENLTLYAIWGYNAVLPETGAPTIAIITMISTISLLASGLYFTLKKKSKIVS